jgi:hypothetical protein
MIHSMQRFHTCYIHLLPIFPLLFSCIVRILLRSHYMPPSASDSWLSDFTDSTPIRAPLAFGSPVSALLLLLSLSASLPFVAADAFLAFVGFVFLYLALVLVFRQKLLLEQRLLEFFTCPFESFRACIARRELVCFGRCDFFRFAFSLSVTGFFRFELA